MVGMMMNRNKIIEFTRTIICSLIVIVYASTAFATGFKTPNSPNIDISTKANPPAKVDISSQSAANAPTYNSTSSSITNNTSLTSDSVNIARPDGRGQGSFAKIDNSSNPKSNETLVTKKEPALSNSDWHKNAPDQVTPSTKTLTHQKYNQKTNQLETSKVEYDQYGRQVKRTDHTDHGYGDASKPREYHSDPHTHIREYGSGYGPKGKETRINK